MAIVNLTQETYARPRCPDGKTKVELCDAQVRGMYLLVQASRPDAAAVFLRYKNADGRTCHEMIGRTSEIDLAEARRRAKEWKARIALGADPRGDARTQREVPTLDAFFTEHYEPFAKPRKRSWARDEELYRLRIKAKFGGRRLNQISRHQVQTFHTELLATGLAPATCDHHLKLLKRMFNLALDWDVFPGPNPVARVPMFNADNKRETYLDDEQLHRLVAVLRTDGNRPVCLIAMFLLSSGARLSEALSATWEQIDEQNRVWRIPALNSKSKRIRSVPLNDSALEVLAELDTKGARGHLFVNAATGKPYTTIAKVWNRLRKEVGIPKLRLHDLRHSFASMLINSGRSLYEVQKLLGHSDTKVSERYAHVNLRTLQDAANAASLKINGGVPPTTKPA